VRQLVRRHARAVVADLDGDLAVGGPRGDRARGVAGSVHQRVGEQVVDRAAQHFLIADRGQAVGDPHLPGLRGIGDPGPLGAPSDHGGQVDRLAGLACPYC
jgi:hypothetical protein